MLSLGTNVVTRKFGHGIVVGVFPRSRFAYNVEFEDGRQELYTKEGFFYPTEEAYAKSCFSREDVDFAVE